MGSDAMLYVEERVGSSFFEVALFDLDRNYQVFEAIGKHGEENPWAPRRSGGVELAGHLRGSRGGYVLLDSYSVSTNVLTRDKWNEAMSAINLGNNARLHAIDRFINSWTGGELRIFFGQDQ